MSESAHETHRQLTWSALVAKWTEFAQQAVALPEEGDGGRWRAAVAPVIGLQAMVHALGEIDEVSDEERPLALDKAELVCRQHTKELHEIWRGEPLPREIGDLVQDARIAFEAAANAGVEWLVTSDRLVAHHPGGLQEKLQKIGFDGELFVPAPGVPLFRGSVAAFARGRGGTAPSDAAIREIEFFLTRGEGARIGEPERIAIPRQVYRQFDFGGGLTLGGAGAGGSGGAKRDLLVPMNETLPPGQPLLVLAFDAGEPQPVPPPPTRPVRMDPVPVEEWRPE